MESSGLFIALTVICIMLVIYYIVSMIDKEEKLYQHIPGPQKASYLLGHIPDLRRAMESKDSMIQDLLYKWAEQHGMTYKIFVFHKAVVVTAHPTGVKEALLGGHPKAEELYRCLVNLYGVRFLGDGLVTLTSHSKWSHRRRAMDPAFRRQFLKGLMEQFNSSSDVLVAKLANFADTKNFISMAKEFHRITLDLIGKVAFNMDINSIHNPSSPFPTAIETILEAMYAQLFKGDFGLNPFNRVFYKRAREAVAFLRSVGRDLIEMRRASMINNEPIPEDILTHAIRVADHDQELSLESMLDDFITFFIAGHETTANTLSFILLELGRRPDVLNRVRQEISNVVGSDSDLKYEHIANLHYMTMVMKESMRLYPTAPSTFRKMSHQCNIGGYIVPTATIVMVSSFVASRNPAIFDDPLEFKPERFDPKFNGKIPIYSFFPFSLGPRSCIGQAFAQIQTKVILAKFLIAFDFELKAGQNLEMEEVATIKPKCSVEVTLTTR